MLKSELKVLTKLWYKRLKQTGYVDLEFNLDLSPRESLTNPFGSMISLTSVYDDERGDNWISRIELENLMTFGRLTTFSDTPKAIYYRELEHAANALPDSHPDRDNIIRYTETGLLPRASKDTVTAFVSSVFGEIQKVNYFATRGQAPRAGKGKYGIGVT